MLLFLGTTPTIQRTMVFDRLTIDAVNRSNEVRTAASGKAINAARVARTLGAEVGATGFLGGMNGEFIRRDLSAANIASHFVEVSPSTRTCVTMIDSAAQTSTELVEESLPVDGEAHNQLLTLLDSLLSNTHFLILSGSLTPNGPIDYYARCVSAARARNVPTMIDARGEPLRLALRSHPTVIKPNLSEMEDTLNRDLDSDSAIRDGMLELTRRGAGHVVVTRGAESVFATDGRTVWRLSVPRVSPVSPIGSGDSLAGGLATGMSRNLPFEQAVRLGVACAVANVLTPLAGFVELSDVQDLHDQITIREA